MANPYRKLFNLFAFSVLAFAVYLNFFRTDDDLSSPKPSTAPQSVAVAKSKSIAANSNSDKSSVKEEKKN